MCKHIEKLTRAKIKPKSWTRIIEIGRRIEPFFSPLPHINQNCGNGGGNDFFIENHNRGVSDRGYTSLTAEFENGILTYMG